MNEPDAPALPTAHAKPAARRSREELETLAAQFVGATPEAEVATAAAPRPALLIAAAAAVLVLGSGAWFAMSGGDDEGRAAREADLARAASEAEAIAKRIEAERERNRQQVASASDYLDRVAAQDRAILGEMSERAEVLERRADATERAEKSVPPAKSGTAPAVGGGAARASAEPPKTEPAPKAETSPKPAPAPAQAKPAEPQPTAPARAATVAPPQQEVASAAAPAGKSTPSLECRMHVSELSKSGKLTYADVSRMKGVKLDNETGRLLTPPVPVQGSSRSIVFEVYPDGCMRIKYTVRR